MKYPNTADPFFDDEPVAPYMPDLAALRTSLLRYARARQRNATLAEDAVSDTLLAAWQAQMSFPTHAQGTAWVYGILRHKLVDQIRQQSREVPAGDALPEPDTRSPDWFVGAAWCGMTSTQTEPEHACAQQQFLDLVLRCCDQLPPMQRQAFLLRELLDDEPASVCAELGITEGNLWVLVHRARARLRGLLQKQGSSPHEEPSRRSRRGACVGPRRRACIEGSATV